MLCLDALSSRGWCTTRTITRFAVAVRPSPPLGIKRTAMVNSGVDGKKEFLKGLNLVGTAENRSKTYVPLTHRRVLALRVQGRVTEGPGESEALGFLPGRGATGCSRIVICFGRFEVRGVGWDLTNPSSNTGGRVSVTGLESQNES